MPHLASVVVRRDPARGRCPPSLQLVRPAADPLGAAVPAGGRRGPTGAAEEDTPGAEPVTSGASPGGPGPNVPVLGHRGPARVRVRWDDRTSLAAGRLGRTCATTP